MPWPPGHDAAASVDLQTSPGMSGPRATLVGVRVRLFALLAVGVACVSLASAALGAPATLKVNTFRDELRARNGRCSLREAIVAAGAPGRRTDCGIASRRSNMIVLRSGRYLLSIPLAGGDDDTSGDLDVTGRAPLTITGAGARATAIDASRVGDRVLSVASAASLTLRLLRITGGRTPAGGAGPAGPGDVTCTRGGAGAAGSDAGNAGSGGGILNRGTLVLDTVAVVGNYAAAGGSGGAGGSQSGTGGCSGGNGGHARSGEGRRGGARER